jgi:hypothetical protein
MGNNRVKFGETEENFLESIWRYVLPKYLLEKTEDNHEHVAHLQAKHTTLVQPTFR